MSFIFNIETLEQLNTLDKIGVTKVILSCKELSRDGRLDKRELFSIYERCRELGYEAHLDADVLLLENDFSNYLEHLSSYLDLGWKSLRVTDPGLLNYLLANTEEKITWVMDLGNHNLKAIQTWKNIIGDRLNSLVISSEISYETLKHYTSRLNVNTEILGLGPILLFYSPRKLLSYYLDKPEDFYQSDYYIEATGSSEESPHKGFPLTENKFGSFMYLPKYLNLLDYQAELSISGISQFRIDLRDEPSCWHSASELQKLLKGDISFKELSQRDFTRGYFKKNKSDVLFHKLKNVDNLTKETNYLGDIVESVKESHMTLEIKKTKIKKGLEIDIITPDKKSKTFKMELLKSIDGRILNEAGPGDYLVLPFLSGMSSNSRVYLRSE